MFGGTSLMPDPKSSKPMSARDINGNLDWHCGHCKKLNFARTIICISCSREVDDRTLYVDCTDFQARGPPRSWPRGARARVASQNRTCPDDCARPHRSHTATLSRRSRDHRRRGVADALAQVRRHEGIMKLASRMEERSRQGQ